MKSKADGQNKNIQNLNKLLNFMEKIGNKLNILQELEIDIRLEVTLRNFSNDLKALINNLKAKKVL